MSETARAWSAPLAPPIPPPRTAPAPAPIRPPCNSADPIWEITPRIPPCQASRSVSVTTTSPAMPPMAPSMAPSMRAADAARPTLARPVEQPSAALLTRAASRAGPDNPRVSTKRSARTAPATVAAASTLPTRAILAASEPSRSSPPAASEAPAAANPPTAIRTPFAPRTWSRVGAAPTAAGPRRRVAPTTTAVAASTPARSATRSTVLE